MKKFIGVFSVSLLLAIYSNVAALAQEVQAENTCPDVQALELEKEPVVLPNIESCQQVEDATNTEKGEANPETVAGTGEELIPQSEVLGASTTAAKQEVLSETGMPTAMTVALGIVLAISSLLTFRFSTYRYSSRHR